MTGATSRALAASQVPFGGPNLSGISREGGPEGNADDLDTSLVQVAL
jgi:succinate-semialdehyde dehydrogenase/glutarate-semialdehyde dehydrogenase